MPFLKSFRGIFRCGNRVASTVIEERREGISPTFAGQQGALNIFEEEIVKLDISKLEASIGDIKVERSYGYASERASNYFP